jgi:hypothetical protein
MSFQECELAILRHSVDESEKQIGKRMANSPEVLRMIHILEGFLKKKKLVCYGGTAINNILPKTAQFYDKNVEIPDYDFFSPHALTDAKELADIYSKEGYADVEAKSGVHSGTYKVYVNFIAVADITYLHPILYASLKKDSIHIDGIRYAPPNYLRMGMFLELSRPEGDVSRWEKVLKRMNLLNKYYPLKADTTCNTLEIQRPAKRSLTSSENLFFLMRDILIDQGVVFFGGYASSLYSKYMNPGETAAVKHTPDFDVLAEDPEKTAKLVVEHLRENGFDHIRLVQHTGLGEVIPEHIEVIVEKETVAFIYRTIACHSYNTITVDNRELNIATIDTMLSFYLAFLYANKKYYDKKRILCLSMYLFQVEQHNRLSQKGLLKRFSTKCYGTQETVESIRAKKAREYAILSKNPKSIEFETAFLKYTPRFTKKAPLSSKEKPRETISQTYDILSDSLVDKIPTNTPENSLRKKHRRTKKRSQPAPKPETISMKELPLLDKGSPLSDKGSPLPEEEDVSLPKKEIPKYTNWLSRLRNESE